MELKKEPGRISYTSPEGELLCEITFPDENGVADINHTFVSEKLRGQGMAGKLVAAAMEQIGERSLKVSASCSYAAGWLEKHPEFDSIKA
ncbi:MAG: N-acetyltransferase [Oscillospiraceae bacterium]|nr:N-acetyltransferase [Oscillospiraceae bacterium]